MTSRLHYLDPILDHVNGKAHRPSYRFRWSMHIVDPVRLPDILQLLLPHRLILKQDRFPGVNLPIRHRAKIQMPSHCDGRVDQIRPLTMPHRCVDESGARPRPTTHFDVDGGGGGVAQLAHQLVRMPDPSLKRDTVCVSNCNVCWVLERASSDEGVESEAGTSVGCHSDQGASPGVGVGVCVGVGVECGKQNCKLELSLVKVLVSSVTRRHAPHTHACESTRTLIPAHARLTLPA